MDKSRITENSWNFFLNIDKVIYFVYFDFRSKIFFSVNLIQFSSYTFLLIIQFLFFLEIRIILRISRFRITLQSWIFCLEEFFRNEIWKYLGGWKRESTHALPWIL